MQYRILIACGLWLVTPLLLLSEAEWVRLWPSVVAIACVFLLRKAILGLLAGATAGMMLLEQGNPLAVFVSFFRDHLLPSLQSSWNLSILLFTLILGGFVSVVSRGGGIEAALRSLDRPQAARQALDHGRNLWVGFRLFF
jgi:tetracycline resistance efflux pump